MIKVNGRYLWRGGEKIGFIRDEHVWSHEGEKLGYWREDHIFDMGGHKVAYLQADYIYFNNSARKVRIEDNNKEIIGGDLSDIERAAVLVFLGE
jgi:hypothetical protein